MSEILETPDATQVDPTEQAETSPATEAADLEQTPTQDDKPRGGGFQRKIEKLTREKYELSGQIRELRASIDQLRAGQSAGERREQQASDPEPKETDYATYEQYVKAAATWVARQEFNQLSAKQREADKARHAQERDQEVVSSYREKLVDFAAEHDDFNEVVGQARLAEDIAGPVQVALMEDDNGPALAYYLGQNPEICDYLNDLTPSGAIKFLGRLSERLYPVFADEESEQEEEPAPPPKAALPQPIKPTKKSAPTDKGLSDQLESGEWMRRFKEKMGYK